MILSDEEKRTTAYHEAGHALMAKLLPGTDPVHKVTIIPRGRALGVTMQLPTDDRHNYSKEFLYNQPGHSHGRACGGRVGFERHDDRSGERSSSGRRISPEKWSVNGA